MINKIHKYINESSEVLKSLAKHAKIIEKISKQILICHKNKGKILVCGNGGSQADADHFVGELVCTYSKRNRKPISAISLSQPIAALTAWSNDFKYNTLLQRQVKAHGKKNDILFLISTSGGSKKNKTSLNLVYAAEEAKKKE